MATKPIGINFSNATIFLEQNEIIEYPKKKDEPAKVYDLRKILQSFDGVDGILFSISGKSEIIPDEERF